MSYFWTAGDQITADRLNRTGFSFDAIVAASGGDYTSIASAVSAGKKRIFVKAGTYSEAKINITNEGTIIVGEGRGRVIINSTENAGDTTARAIEIAAHRVQLHNLQINGYESGGTLYTYYLIYTGLISGGYKGISIWNCDFSKMKGCVIDGNYSQYNILNCYIDATAKIISLEHLFTNLHQGSLIVGCQIDSQTTTDDAMGIFFNIFGSIIGCEIKGRVITANLYGYQGSMIGSKIFAKKQYWGIGSYSNNYFNNNEYDPGTGVDDYMVYFSGYFTRIINNQFFCNYYARKPVSVEGPNSVFMGNIIDSGTKVRIKTDANYVQWCNNIWYPSSVTQDVEVLLGANYCQVNENIIGETGGTPAIIDSGTGNNKLNNILYTA